MVNQSTAKTRELSPKGREWTLLEQGHLSSPYKQVEETFKMPMTNNIPHYPLAKGIVTSANEAHH